ncbi:MAG: cytochrome C' [Dechloromonas sp.]|nr:cytochrome C' [Dechloromonas sp.]
MRTLLIAAALAAGATGALANADEALNKAGCMACHAKDKKLVGPSFKDIAAKYKGQDVVAKLMDKVRKGGAARRAGWSRPPRLSSLRPVSRPRRPLRRKSARYGW